jgi:high affinity Mn2+ porin
MAGALFRQTIDLSGRTVTIEPDLDQLGGQTTANRVVLTAGKFAPVDVFDTNTYAHEPREDFLNWSVTDVGTFDFGADAWGSSYGAAAEWYQDRYTFRAGMFDLSDVPNGTGLSLPLTRQFQSVSELKESHLIWHQPGTLGLLYYLTYGVLGTYSDALALARATGTTPSTAAVRHFRFKYGVSLDLEQHLASDLGFFARLGWSQPGVEEDDFTDIDQTLALGLMLSGGSWGRPDDKIGLAGVANQISRDAKMYFRAGGIGGVIGDGQLPRSGPEQIVEVFYRFSANRFTRITGDYQYIGNPAYNRQRGPVSILALRVHAEF